MVGNMSFYRLPNFGAVMNRFSIFKKIKRKTPFFPARKGFHYLTQALMGKMLFFFNQYFHYILTHRNPSLGFI
jgi:hypothetical protein